MDQEPKIFFDGNRAVFPYFIIQSALSLIVQKLNCFVSSDGIVTYSGCLYSFDARKENAHKIHVAALQSFQIFYQNYSELSDECDFLNAFQDHDYYLRTIASTAFLAMIVSNPKLIEDFNEDGCFFEFSPIIPRWVKEIVKIVIFQEDGSLQFIYWPYHLYTSSTSACLQF